MIILLLLPILMQTSPCYSSNTDQQGSPLSRKTTMPYTEEFRPGSTKQSEPSTSATFQSTYHTKEVYKFYHAEEKNNAPYTRKPNIYQRLLGEMVCAHTRLLAIETLLNALSEQVNK